MPIFRSPLGQGLSPMFDPRPQRLSWLRLLAFAAPAAPLAALSVPLNVYLPALYVRGLGLDMASVGLIFLAARLFDIVIDPTIGWLSDATRSRLGRRRPWMVAAVPLLVLFTWRLFMPAHGASAVDLAFGLFGVYIGFSMLGIPHLSWSAEAPGTATDRLRIQSYVAAMTAAGVVIGLGAPLVVQWLGRTDIPGEVSIGAFIMIAAPISVACAVLALAENPSVTRQGSFLELVGEVVRSAPLRILLLCDLAYGLAIGMTATLFVFYLEGVLGLRASTVPLLFFYGAAIASTPAWLWLARWVPKARLAAVAAVASALTTLNWIALAQASRHVAGLETLVMIQMGAFGFVGGNIYAVLRALMADFANEREQQGRGVQTGACYALLSLTGKLGLALATGLGLMVLGYFKVDPHQITVDRWPVFFALFTGAPAASFGVIALLLARYAVGPSTTPPDAREGDPA